MGSRFFEVISAHWPVFALLAGLGLVMGLIAFVRGRRAAETGVPGGVIFGWGCVFALPPLVYVLGLASGLSVESAIFTALLAAAVLLWVFGLVEEFVPALVAVVAALFVGLAPAEVALAGFASPALLLLLGVYALSAVISSSGLSYRLMLRLLLRLPDKPVWHQVTLLGTGYLLSPLMPSANARMSMLMPVFKDMATGLKLPARGPALTALLAAMFVGPCSFRP
jgi:Di- and tricarboxylate transporters